MRVFQSNPHMTIQKRWRDIIRAGGVAAVCLALGSQALATPKPQTHEQPEVLTKAVKSKHFDTIVLQPDATFSGFDSVYIAPVTVEFNKHWLRDHRSDVSSYTKTDMKERYGKLLRQQLAEALVEKGDLTLVEEPTDTTLIVRPSLLELSINAPETVAITKVYAYRAGHAKIALELASRKNGEEQLLGRFSDHDSTRTLSITRPERMNRVRNYRDFRFLMQRWAKRFREELTTIG